MSCIGYFLGRSSLEETSTVQSVRSFVQGTTSCGTRLDIAGELRSELMIVDGRSVIVEGSLFLWDAIQFLNCSWYTK